MTDDMLQQESKKLRKDVAEILPLF